MCNVHGRCGMLRSGGSTHESPHCNSPPLHVRLQIFGKVATPTNVTPISPLALPFPSFPLNPPQTRSPGHADDNRGRHRVAGVHGASMSLPDLSTACRASSLGLSTAPCLPAVPAACAHHHTCRMARHPRPNSGFLGSWPWTTRARASSLRWGPRLAPITRPVFCLNLRMAPALGLSNPWMGQGALPSTHPLAGSLVQTQTQLCI